MWILFGLLVTAAVMMLGSFLGELGWALLGVGLLIGSLWEVIAQLVKIREAIEAQGAPPPGPAPRLAFENPDQKEGA